MGSSALLPKTSPPSTDTSPKLQSSRPRPPPPLSAGLETASLPACRARPAPPPLVPLPYLGLVPRSHTGEPCEGRDPGVWPAAAVRTQRRCAVRAPFHEQ